ncbi:MAG: ABC transporter permease [Clostridia bacterium]|nr:ABC transporter permease [Clostridia bacterium]
MSFLIRQTLLFAVPLMIVALAGVFSERSGVINLALEGIMIFGAFVGVLFVYYNESIPFLQEAYTGLKTLSAIKVDARDAAFTSQLTEYLLSTQGFSLVAMLVTALCCAAFSMLLAFAAIHLRADQTIVGTALNLLAPALVLFFVRLLANQNTLNIAGESSSWFMLKESYFGFGVKLTRTTKTASMGFFGQAFVNQVYPMTYVCILLFVVMSIFLYKTRFGLRLRACGENPQAADSLGINVYRMRYAGVGISGALAGIGGFLYATTTMSCSSNGDVAGFGFLALAVMIFGNWKPGSIVWASLLFGLMKCISATYTRLDFNTDGIYELAELGISKYIYKILPYVITLLVLAFTSKRSRAPKAEGIPYDKSVR